MKKITTYCFWILLSITSYGQAGVLSSGGEGLGTGGTISFSVGQVFVGDFNGDYGNVAEGMQQTFVLTLLGGIETNPFELATFPNPTTDVITLKAQQYHGEKLQYQLYDLEGRLIDQQDIVSGETQIDLSQQPSNIYLLRVSDDRSMTTTFKIVKVE